MNSTIHRAAFGIAVVFVVAWGLNGSAIAAEDPVNGTEVNPEPISAEISSITMTGERVNLSQDELFVESGETVIIDSLYKNEKDRVINITGINIESLPRGGLVGTEDAIVADERHSDTFEIKLNGLAETNSQEPYLRRIGVSSVHQSGITGEDVKIGIVGGGFNTSIDDLSQANITKKSFAITPNNPLNSPLNKRHGTSIAEITHEVAPESELYLATIEGTKNDPRIPESQTWIKKSSLTFREAVHWLANEQNVDVIVTAMGFTPKPPWNGSSVVAETASNAVENGTIFVAAAGNYNDRLWFTEQALDSDGDGWIEYSTKPASERNYITNVDTVDLLLRWQNSSRDYSLHLYNASTGEKVADTENIEVEPTATPTLEKLKVDLSPSHFYYVKIKGNPGGNPLLLLRRPGWGQFLNYTSKETIAPPGTGQSIMTVGGYDVDTGEIDIHSSRGPTVDGRRGIDVVAPAEVNTTLYSNFSGTSAASPQVGGIAGLMLQLNQGYAPTITKSSLQLSANDIQPKGADPKTGFGKVDAERAILGTNVKARLVTGPNEVKPRQSVIANFSLGTLFESYSDWILSGQTELANVNWEIVKIDERGTVIAQKTITGQSFEIGLDSSNQTKLIKIRLTAEVPGPNNLSETDLVLSKFHQLQKGGAVQSLEKWNLSVNPDQVPVKKIWSRTYGKDGWEKAYDIEQTENGNFVFAGQATSYRNGSENGWLVKIESNGTEVWNRTYGGGGWEHIYAADRINKGGYILGGVTTTFGDGSEAGWLIKVESDGTEVWNKTYGGSPQLKINDVLQTADGGYIFVGYTQSGEPPIQDDGPYAWVTKVGINGSVVWNKTYGNEGYGAWKVHQTADGGYVIAGETDVPNEQLGGDAWILKLRSNGIKEWSRTYGGDLGDGAYDIVESNQGGYVLAGATASYVEAYQDAWVVNIESDGSERWNRTYGAENKSERATAIEPTPGGNYTIALRYNPRLINIGRNGSILWSQSYEQGNILNLQRIGCGEYIFSGYNRSARFDTDALVSKIKSQNGGPPEIIKNNEPKDPDNDCKYEDVNGDGTVDFDDAVGLAFNLNDDNVQPQWFDFDGDGDVDFDDAVTLAFA